MSEFSNICRTVLRRARYFKDIKVSSTEDIPKLYPEKLLTVLRTGNDEPALIFMVAYTCRGYIPKTKTIITTYKIAAGPENTSVIVLRKIDCPNNAPHISSCYEIIELIANVSLEYVNFIFKR